MNKNIILEFTKHNKIKIMIILGIILVFLFLFLLGTLNLGKDINYIPI